MFGGGFPGKGLGVWCLKVGFQVGFWEMGVEVWGVGFRVVSGVGC